MSEYENTLQLFRLSEKIWDSMTYEDIKATWKDMVEAGITRPPFLEFAVEVKLEFLRRLYISSGGDDELDTSVSNQLFYCEFEFKTFDPIGDEFECEWLAKVLYSNGKNRWVIDPICELQNPNLFEFGRGMAAYVASILIILLATKNSKTESVLNKKLLKGKVNNTNEYRKMFPTTTTISIGKISETCTREGEDPRYVRPHLRRGHLRNQHYGPDRSMVKQIFISPVFVNASEGWIAERKAYNVSVGHGRVQKQTDSEHGTAL